jgi:RNA polymerase sigma factor (sigma-70 family)
VELSRIIFIEECGNRETMTPASGKAKITSASQFADSRLVQQCLKGDEAAWATLIQKYKNLIFSIPVRYGFSEEDSADIFQSVCMDLLTELPRLREPNALAGWLIQVARNKCFHRKRAEQRHPVQEIGDVDSCASPEDPGHLVAQVEQEQALREALLELSPRCRELMHMLFFEEPVRPYQQIAKDLDLATGSIGFIRRRCLNKLMQRLEQLGFNVS